MPHDIFGREIQKGDVVLATCWPDAAPAAKKVIAIAPGTDTCNLSLADFEPRLGAQNATAKETKLILKADGTEPAAPQAAPLAEEKKES